MKLALATLLLLMSSSALATGSVTCASTHAADQLVVSWGTMHGIGSPRIGPLHVEYRGSKYVLGLDPKKSPAGTTALPVEVVGYWVEPGMKVLVKVTDDQILRTMLHIEATATKGDVLGEAYMQLAEKQPSRKMQVHCSFE